VQGETVGGIHAVSVVVTAGVVGMAHVCAPLCLKMCRKIYI
jgi:hypothetical protein